MEYRKVDSTKVFNVVDEITGLVLFNTDDIDEFKNEAWKYDTVHSAIKVVNINTVGGYNLYRMFTLNYN